MRGQSRFRSLALAPIVSVLGVGFAVVACGDDDSASPSTTPDAATQNDTSVTPPSNDGGSGTDATTVDADAAVTAAAVRPQTTAKLLNAINPYGLVFGSDGFLYASGATMDSGTRKLAVWRFKDGALDTTFGTSGVLTKDITGDESSWDMVEVSAGNFVVQATAGGKVYLSKLTKDAGTGAFSFGDPVQVELGDWLDSDPAWTASSPAAPAYSSWSIAVDKSVANTPKIVVFASGAPAKVASGTQRFDNDRWIARVMADTLATDTSFNGGKAFSSDSDGKGLNDSSRRGLVLADGSIVSAGYTNFEGTVRHHVVIIKLTNTGAVDNAFGFGSTVAGETKINPFLASSGFTEAYGIARQSTGRLVTTGYGTSNFDVPSKSVDLISLGVLPGSLDATYGKQGAFAFQSEQDPAAGVGTVAHTERGRDMAVLPDDRTVHFGAYDDSAAIYVLDKNGKADVGSGVNGLLEYAIPANFFRGVVSPDGKTIAATTQSVNVTIDGGAVPQSILATLKVGQ